MIRRNFGGLKHFKAMLLYLQFMYQTYFNCSLKKKIVQTLQIFVVQKI